MHSALVCRPLEAVAPHLFTTRGWALGASGSDEHEAWREVADALAVGPDDLVRVRQVHGATVVVRRAGRRPAQYVPADIIISDDPAAALAVQSADCVPLLLADPRTGAAAAAHAGWRGLAAGVPRVTVEALVSEFGSRPADLVAAIGPCIAACCYEVGADVRQRFDDAGFLPEMVASWFVQWARPTPRNPSMPRVASAATTRANHSYFDGGAAARDALALAGVPRDQIFVADLCTASHPGTLCSYRRDGADAGRIAGAIRPRGI